MNRPKPLLPLRIATLLAILTTLLISTTSAGADPCGMVPPIQVQADPDLLVRTGLQRTYVFYSEKTGIEDFIVRPAFIGKVGDFGMLIPFPSVPAIRKVPDNIFGQIAKAIDPPVINIYPFRGFDRMMSVRKAQLGARARSEGAPSAAVRLIKQEAVGMYQVAVLEAGSPEALARWMKGNGYVYPEGMDDAIQSYVSRKWCFVAVKARVGALKKVNPRPGMKSTDPKLPAGEEFKGAVQAMGFRFRVKPFVLPMRLASYNRGPLENEIVCLTDGPIKIDPLPASMVVRQLTGEALHSNVTQLLPYRIVGPRRGNEEPQVNNAFLKAYNSQRNPEPHNGRARELFAGDLLAVRTGRLSHPFEEREKELYLVNEALGLRGSHLDRIVRQSLQEIREKEIDGALEDLKKMTLTVIRGDLPRMVIRYQDLTLSAHQIAKGLEPLQPLDRTPQPHNLPSKKKKSSIEILLGFLLILLLISLGLRTHRSEHRLLGRGLSPWILMLALIFAATWTQTAVAEEETPSVAQLCDQLYNAKTAYQAAQTLLTRGEEALPKLLGIVGERGDDIAARGWAMSVLAHHGDSAAIPALRRSLQDPKEQPIVRLWAARSLLILGQIQPILQISQSGNASPSLRQAITKILSKSGPEVGPALIEMMFSTHKNDAQIARTAAAYLGAKGIDSPANRRLFLERLDGPKPRQKKTWGNVLWIPGVNWSADEARDLTRILIDWMKFCEERQDRNTWNQVRNNLVSVGRRVGLNPRGSSRNWWNQGSEMWEKAWQKRFGQEGSNR